MQRTNTSIQNETVLKECFVSRLIIVCLDLRVMSVIEAKLHWDRCICHQRVVNDSLSETTRSEQHREDASLTFLLIITGKEGYSCWGTLGLVLGSRQTTRLTTTTFMLAMETYRRAAESRWLTSRLCFSLLVSLIMAFHAVGTQQFINRGTKDKSQWGGYLICSEHHHTLQVLGSSTLKQNIQHSPTVMATEFKFFICSEIWKWNQTTGLRIWS